MNIIKGTKGNDTLSGTDEPDRIYGYAGRDILDGGAGNDKLYGASGNDTYLFGIGSGQDTVSEYNFSIYPVNRDTIQLGNGIAPTDVTIRRGISDLTIKINGTTEKLTLPYWFASDANKIEQVKFADGTLWDIDALLANLTDRAATESRGRRLPETISGGSRRQRTNPPARIRADPVAPVPTSR